MVPERDPYTEIEFTPGELAELGATLRSDASASPETTPEAPGGRKPRKRRVSSLRVPVDEVPRAIEPVPQAFAPAPSAPIELLGVGPVAPSDVVVDQAFAHDASTDGGIGEPPAVPSLGKAPVVPLREGPPVIVAEGTAPAPRVFEKTIRGYAAPELASMLAEGRTREHPAAVAHESSDEAIALDDADVIEEPSRPEEGGDERTSTRERTQWIEADTPPVGSDVETLDALARSFETPKTHLPETRVEAEPPFEADTTAAAPTPAEEEPKAAQAAKATKQRKEPAFLRADTVPEAPVEAKDADVPVRLVVLEPGAEAAPEGEARPLRSEAAPTAEEVTHPHAEDAGLVVPRPSTVAEGVPGGVVSPGGPEGATSGGKALSEATKTHPAQSDQAGAPAEARSDQDLAATGIEAQTSTVTEEIPLTEEEPESGDEVPVQTEVPVVSLVPGVGGGGAIEELSAADLEEITEGPAEPGAVRTAAASEEGNAEELSGADIEEIADVAPPKAALTPGPGAVTQREVARTADEQAGVARAEEGRAASPSVTEEAAAHHARLRRPWFEVAFDEDYLRTLPFLTAEQTRREVAFIEQSLGLAPGMRVLDVGCGWGRHAMELAARGYNVTGIDLSLPLLLRAAEEAQRRGVKVNFVHGDMREMAFDEPFDAIYVMGTTFGFFDDETNRKVAQRLARFLKPGRRILVDVVNRDYIIGDLPARVWWEGDGCLVLEEVEFNYYKSRIMVHRSVAFEDGRQVEHDLSIRAYSLHELGRILQYAGLRVIEVSGHLVTRGYFFGSESRQILMLAERVESS